MNKPPCYNKQMMEREEFERIRESLRQEEVMKEVSNGCLDDIAWRCVHSLHAPPTPEQCIRSALMTWNYEQSGIGQTRLDYWGEAAKLVMQTLKDWERKYDRSISDD
jgi:hypothetical protein